MKAYLFLAIAAIIAISGLLFIWKYEPASSPEVRVEITHQQVVDKIERLGKLELSKYYIKDIIEKKEVKEWYKLDPKVVLIITGEVIGCMDITKIDSSAIQIDSARIIVTLPNPEICVFKIDHQQSKVYNIENSFFYDDKVLIDEAYKYAETSIRQAALKRGILEETKKSSEKILQPFLAGFFPGKEIILKHSTVRP